MSELLAKISIRLECNHASGKKIDHIIFMLYSFQLKVNSNCVEKVLVESILRVA